MKNKNLWIILGSLFNIICVVLCFYTINEYHYANAILGIIVIIFNSIRVKEYLEKKETISLTVIVLGISIIAFFFKVVYIITLLAISYIIFSIGLKRNWLKDKNKILRFFILFIVPCFITLAMMRFYSYIFAYLIVNVENNIAGWHEALSADLFPLIIYQIFYIFFTFFFDVKECKKICIYISSLISVIVITTLFAINVVNINSLKNEITEEIKEIERIQNTARVQRDYKNAIKDKELKEVQVNGNSPIGSIKQYLENGRYIYIMDTQEGNAIECKEAIEDYLYVIKPLEGACDALQGTFIMIYTMEMLTVLAIFIYSKK